MNRAFLRLAGFVALLLTWMVPAWAVQYAVTFDPPLEYRCTSADQLVCWLNKAVESGFTVTRIEITDDPTTQSAFATPDAELLWSLHATSIRADVIEGTGDTAVIVRSGLQWMASSDAVIEVPTIFGLVPVDGAEFRDLLLSRAELRLQQHLDRPPPPLLQVSVLGPLAARAARAAQAPPGGAAQPGVALAAFAALPATHADMASAATVKVPDSIVLPVLSAPRSSWATLAASFEQESIAGAFVPVPHGSGPMPVERKGDGKEPLADSRFGQRPLRNIPTREVEAELRRLGWQLVRQGGHRIFKHPQRPEWGLVSLPINPSTDVPAGTLKAILRQMYFIP